MTRSPVVTTTYGGGIATRPDGRPRFVPAGWPLTLLYLYFPVWWLLGVSHFVFLGAAAVMGMELLRRRPVYAPMAFGLWMLFLLVVIAGVGLLWVEPVGTVPIVGTGRLVYYVYRTLWYAGITVTCLYVLNIAEEDLPTERVMRLLAWMFVYTTAGGLAGLLFPQLDFPSALELVVHVPSGGFLHSLIHPTIVLNSGFLGFEQGRPMAPFAFPNAWGNNLGLFLPFFVATWMGKGAGWRRPVGAAILAVSVIPVTLSLNRGLWIGLGVGLALVAIRLAMMGRTRVLQISIGLLVAGGFIFVSSPLYDRAVLRVETPDSDARRGTVASQVVEKTLEGSPLLGFGDTREVTGSFNSIAGGETPSCHQCAAPTLGTQGYMWRLIFTTGVVGTILFLSFMAAQFVRFIGSSDPVALIGCTVIVMGLVFSFVYDSLESPMVTVFVAIGLMNRRYIQPGQIRVIGSPVRRPPAVHQQDEPNRVKWLRAATSRVRWWWTGFRLWVRG